MAKDPAALFYIDHWLASTREMRADCRGWYLNLVLHQFKSGSLPADMEELANLASVRVSEYDLFQQVFQQVLKQKFVLLPTGRLQDAEAAEIIRSREVFVEKRALSGRKSVFIKFIKKELCQDETVINFMRENVSDEQLSTTDQQVLKQVFKDLFQVYINRNKDINRIEVDVGGKGEEEAGRESGWNQFPGPLEAEKFNLPESTIETSVRLYALAGVTATPAQIEELWKSFKDLKFKGKKFYQDQSDVFEHFVNWSKSQKINGTNHESGFSSEKSGTSTARVAALKKW